MSIDNLLLSIKAVSTKTAKNAPVDSQAQTANPFAASLFSNAFNPNTQNASFNNNVGNSSLFNSNSNLTFGFGQSQGGASIFNSRPQVDNRHEHHVTKKPTNPSEQQGGVSELINLVKALLEELKNNKNTNETQSPDAEEHKTKKKEKKGGGFFGFIKDAVSTVAPMAMSMLGGGATGGMGNIASGLLGKFLG